LIAFYQKKLTIHTTILVRYSINHFQVKIENKKLKFLDSSTNLKCNEKDIQIYKIYQFSKNYEKFYLITNLGIFIGYFLKENVYEITDLFLETTPGRLIFSINFKNSLKT
jgi:hypothetical protein